MVVIIGSQMYVFVLYKYFDKFDTDILINLTADMPNIFI